MNVLVKTIDDWIRWSWVVPAKEGLAEVGKVGESDKLNTLNVPRSKDVLRSLFGSLIRASTSANDVSTDPEARVAASSELIICLESSVRLS